MSSVEDRIAAVIHGWTCGMKHRVDDRARCCVTARAVVAELGLTQEIQWGVRYKDGHEETRWSKEAAVYTTKKGSAEDGGVIVQRENYFGSSPWRSVSPKEQPDDQR